MELEAEKIKIRKIIIMGFIVIAVLLFIVGLIKIVKKDKVKTTNFIKQSTSYTIPGTKVSSYLPTITIDSVDTEEVNKEIKKTYEEVITSNKASFNYQYSINSNYFSLVTIAMVTDKETDYTYPIFKTYNFSLSTNRLVSDEELLKKFNKTSSSVATTLERQMKKYYQGELDKYYLDKDECDYNCFLERRNINSYDEDNYLYVENNKLKFFHSFMIFSNIGEEEFYKNEKFLYEVE